MKFALVDNIKAEATKGAKGICSVCNKELIAKCGEVKLHHWAHKSLRNCDTWWENETEWHRSWKNNFSNDWQEFIFRDEQTGEKHIADIHTNHGLVIEFQHSYIEPQERRTRENFYKKIVWIVDGTRLQRDYPRFLKTPFQKTNQNGFYFVESPEKYFPSAWLDSLVPVVFDFRGTEIISDVRDLRNNLYCLFPVRMIEKRTAILVTMTRRFFINNTTNGQWSLWISNVMGNNKQQKPQNQNVNLPTQNINRRIQTHYYDPRTGRYKRRERL